MLERRAPLTIVRHGAPCKFDYAPLGSICKIAKDGSVDIYMQMSHSEDDPRWEMVGTFSNNDSHDYIEKEIEKRLPCRV